MPRSIRVRLWSVMHSIWPTRTVCISSRHGIDATTVSRVLSVMPRDLFGGEAEELRGVVVEDVLLLLDRQKAQAIDAIDGERNGLRPAHLVAPEHHAVQ